MSVEYYSAIKENEANGENKQIAYMRNLKYDTNEHPDEIETDSQTQSTEPRLLRERGDG